MSSIAGLIFNDSPHYLDHLAPFCALQGCPLILCEKSIADLARKFYPDLEVVEQEYWKLDLPATVITCEPKCFLTTALPNFGDRDAFWLPHGNSDKGHLSPLFAPLQNQNVFVYGQQMIDTILASGISPSMHPVGNFRLAYWLRHQNFYQNIFHFPPARLTYLYAPTWDDEEQNSSLWVSLLALAKHLPSDCNLLVKTHPNTERAFLPQLEKLAGAFASQKNIIFLTDCPCVYPLLNLSDVYIGDMSSIGYDFLYWKRPMFFVNQTQNGCPLFSCGAPIALGQAERVFTETTNKTSFNQKEMYNYVFHCNSQHGNSFSLPGSYRPFSVASRGTSHRQ